MRFWRHTTPAHSWYPLHNNWIRCLRRILIWSAAPSPAKGTRPFGIPSLKKCFLGRLLRYFAVAALLRPLANFPGKAGKTAHCPGGNWRASIPGSWAEPQRAVRTGGPAETRRDAEVGVPYKGSFFPGKDAARESGAPRSARPTKGVCTGKYVITGEAGDHTGLPLRANSIGNSGRVNPAPTAEMAAG